MMEDGSKSIAYLASWPGYGCSNEFCVMTHPSISYGLELTDLVVN